MSAEPPAAAPSPGAASPGPFLAGLRVLDLGRVLAAPFATQILADLGAEVLKVEPPWGDDTRRWGPPFQESPEADGEPMAAYFQAANRGKRSRVLDLRQAADRERLAGLAAAADVLVDNYTPTVRERLGLGTLADSNPRLVSLSVVGYPGTRRDDAGYDLLVQAEAGLMGITGPADGEAHKVGVALADVLTGMMAANGIQAALLRRARTGRGARLELSLFRTVLFSLVNVATNHLVSGEASRRWGNAHPNLVPYQPFPAADGTVVLGVGNDRQYRDLCELLDLRGHPVAELDNPGRVEHRDEVVAALAERIARRPADRLLADLASRRIPAAPVLRPDQALQHCCRWDPGTVLALDHATLGTVRTVANPLQADGLAPSPHPPPQLGEGGEEMEARWLGED